MDKALEQRLRDAIQVGEFAGAKIAPVLLDDARRLLLRLKIENRDTSLIYRKDKP